VDGNEALILTKGCAIKLPLNPRQRTKEGESKSVRNAVEPLKAA